MHKLRSALPPKADMCGATREARYGPQADVSFKIVISRVPTSHLAVWFEECGNNLAKSYGHFLPESGQCAAWHRQL
jgi:hypothetical protein